MLMLKYSNKHSSFLRKTIFGSYKDPYKELKHGGRFLTSYYSAFFVTTTGKYLHIHADSASARNC